MNTYFRKISSVLVVLSSLGLGSVGHALPVELLTESNAYPYDNEGANALADGTLVASQYNLFSLVTGGWTLNGSVRSSVMSGAAANTQSGYTFVYEVENLTAKPAADWTPVDENSVGVPNSEQVNPTQGILNFLVPGWNGVSTWVAKSSVGTSSLAKADPGIFNRYGETIDFTFPPVAGPPAPPIFAQEASWQLIVHTNFSSYMDVTSTIVGSDFDFSAYAGGGDYLYVNPIGGTYSTTVQTYGVAAMVPDYSSTVALLSLGLGLLAMANPKRKL